MTGFSQDRWRGLALLLASTALVGTGSAARAQEVAAEEESRQAPVEAPASEGEPERDEAELIITGTRIRNTEFTTSSPVTIIDAERAAESGRITAAEVLHSSPIAASSGQVNSTYTGYVVGGGAGINTVSLRGLGDQRSLLLINGRRLPPSGVGGSVGPVDLSTIPSSIVSRYEILKDGASSVYGSDAVAGVVNVITRDKVEGLNLSATGIATHRGGGAAYQVAGAWGKTFDAGSVSISAEYQDQGALRAGDRSGLACPTHNYFDPDGSRADLIDPATGEFKCYLNTVAEGAVYGYAPIALTGVPILYNVYQVEPGALTDNVRGFSSIEGGLAALSYADPRQLSQTIISPLKQLNVFAQGEYRPEWIGATLYSELLYSGRNSEQLAWSVFRPFFAPKSAVNPFRNAILAGNEQFGEIGVLARPHMLYSLRSEQDVDVWRGLLGGKGSWKSWALDVYASHSLSKGRYSSDAIIDDRVAHGTGTDQNVLDELAGGVCGPGAPAGCVPLDLFGGAALEDGELSQAIRDYYFTRDEGRTSYSQSIAEASATGDLFALPYGVLSAAFGVAVRRDSINDRPGELSENHNIWGRLTAGRTKGSDTVKEVYGEIEGPILRNLPMVEDLKINASARYSHYDSVGGAGTYKVGLNWAINNTVRLRGTHGTSFRAPSLYELFLNDQRGFLEQSDVDPCIGFDQTGADGVFLQTNQRIRENCAAAGLPEGYVGGLNKVTVVMNGGGDELAPERSTASSIGLALTPPRTGLKLALDYWTIRIKDQISNIGSGAVGACYNADDFPESGFCDLFERDAVDFGVDTIQTQYRNIPTERSSGFDLTAAYEREFNSGTLSTDLVASYITEHKLQAFAGDTVYEYVGMLGYPELVANLNVRFKMKTWLAAWTVNYTGPTSNIGRYGETGVLNGGYADGASYRADTNAFITQDLAASYSGNTWQLLAGVINITNQKPPVVGEGVSYSRLGNYPFSSQYSAGLTGRRFFVRVGKLF